MKTKCDEFMQIGEVAKMLGITPRTIRHYEDVGLMGPLNIAENGYRKYAGKQITRIKFILKLKELGISLRDMKEIANNYDLNRQDSSMMMQDLLDVLDLNICRVDNKMNSLQSLKKDICDYKVRIFDLLESDMCN